jgi:hypothetical protein
MIVTLDSINLCSFRFEQEIEGPQAITNVQSNLGSESSPRKVQSGFFRLTRPTTDSSLILTIRFIERSVQLATIQFGNIVAVIGISEVTVSLRPPQIISLLLTVAHQCQGNIWHWQSHV